MPPAPPPAPSSLTGQDRRKKGGAGCLIALGVLLALALAVGLTGYFVVRDSALVGFVGDALDATQKAERAPGTRELRELGCASARVIDLTDFARLAAKHFPEDAGSPLPAEGALPAVVVCEVGAGAPVPTCEQVAATYLRALGGMAPGPFSVSVSVPAGPEGGGDDTRCEMEFDLRGRAIPAAADDPTEGAADEEPPAPGPER